MAIRGDGSTGYLTTPDHINHDWPASSEKVFACRFQIRPGDIDGDDTGYFFSLGAYGAANSLSVLVYHNGWSAAPTSAGKFEMNFENIILHDTAQTIDADDGLVRCMICQREGTDALRMYIGETDGTLTSIDPSVGSSGMLPTTSLGVGGRHNNARHAGFAIWDVVIDNVAMSARERAAYARGASVWKIRNGWQRHWPLRASVASSRCLVTGIDLTRNGTVNSEQQWGEMQAFPAGGAALRASAAPSGDLFVTQLDSGVQIQNVTLVGHPALTLGTQDIEAATTNNAATIITNPTAIKPEIDLRPFLATYENAVGGTDANKWGASIGRVDDPNGRGIIFRLPGTDKWGGTNLSGMLPYHCSDVDPWAASAVWTPFDTVSGTTTLTFEHSTGHPGAQMFYATVRPWPWTALANWFAALDKTYVQETPSSIAFGGAQYAFANIAGATDQNGRSIPAQDQFCWYMTDPAAQPDDGQGKRDAVLLTDVHCAEHVGKWGFVKAIEFLADADAGGSPKQVEAAALLKNFRFWCCPTVQEGTYFSHAYGVAVLNPAPNLGRHWNDAPLTITGGVNVLAALDSDLGNYISYTCDFHSLPNSTVPADEYNLHYRDANDSYADDLYEPAADTYQAGSKTFLANAGSFREEMKNSRGALVSVTAEQAIRLSITESDAQLQAERNLRALNDAWDAGAFFRIGQLDVGVQTKNVVLKGGETPSSSIFESSVVR